MKVDLSEREMELLLHLLTEAVTKVGDGIETFEYPEDEIILLEKLENILKLHDIENIGERKSAMKSKFLN